MKIEQIYTGCLAQGAYYIESQGVAAVIDPLRDPQPYIARAKRDGAVIQYILETHFHADFVSGCMELARKAGATIVYGPGAKPAYGAHIARDGEILRLGDLRIKVLHTPGHTFESVTYLLIDENGKDRAIFTGDTLFLGDVGRPDLAQGKDVNQTQLAGILYDSLREKIMPLADDVIVYPGHGAGSACGKNMSAETVDTLGHQKKTNYALRAIDKATFAKKLLDGLTPPPQYFAKNAALNQKGAPAVDVLYKKGTRPLNPDEFERLAVEEGARILDTRRPADFAKAHIPNAIFIGLDGAFAPWAGTLIADLRCPIVFIAPNGREAEVVQRLARVGHDGVLGYLQGGLEAWVEAGKETASLASIQADELAARYHENTRVLDVRRSDEYRASHIENAISFPLAQIDQNPIPLAAEQPYFLYCAGGYRSVIAASILKSKGFHRLTNIAGGYAAIQTTDLPRTTAVGTLS
ncbi:MAG: MBL fold metallo-hydrolase [Flavobacteriales bacterium]